MGVWGTAVFSDDTACDVRDEYRDLVGDGVPGPEATDAILKQWAGEADYAELGVVWLALAATQWKCGRLEDRVKREALRVIESGSDFDRWEGDLQLIQKRKVNLEKLKIQLLSPQREATRLPKRYRSSCEWKTGELIAYRLLSGNWMFFLVVGHHTDSGGTSPICQLFDKVLDSMPQDLQWNHCSLLVDPDSPEPPRPLTMILGRVKENELPVTRILRLGTVQKLTELPRTGRVVVLWRYLDQFLHNHLKIT